MALKSIRWVFSNESNSDEKITVHDQRSAETLSLILRSHSDVWIMKEEEMTQSISVSPKTVAAAPVVPIKTATAQVKTAPAATKATPPPRPPTRELRGEERRVQKRFAVDLRIILICGTKSFRSISHNVSLGGMKLKNSVPREFMNGPCMAYLSNAGTNENIEMICEVIPDPKDPCRLQFADADPVQLKRLTKWLVENESPRKAG